MPKNSLGSSGHMAPQLAFTATSSQKYPNLPKKSMESGMHEIIEEGDTINSRISSLKKTEPNSRENMIDRSMKKIHYLSDDVVRSLINPTAVSHNLTDD